MAKKSKSGGGAKSGKVKVGGKAGRKTASAQKGQARREAREAARGKKQKQAHGGEEAVAGTRQRLRVKALQKQLDRLPTGSRRTALLRELGQLHADTGRGRLAVECFQEVLRHDPTDSDFAVRTPLLCLLMDEARGEEARELAEGPLFGPLLGDEMPRADAASASRRLATTTGAYSLALLSYISTRVLQEDKEPDAAAASEARLVRELRRAHQFNPFIAEFIAFAPAFQTHFEVGAELPPPEACGSGEQPLLQALFYCCRFGQVSVWLDTDEEVRRFLRCLLFEDADDDDDEKPPFQPLPACAGKEPLLIARWRRAREDAMDLWAEEMSQASGAEGEDVQQEDEEGESGEAGESEGEESMATDEEFSAMEERRGFG